jgi:hypothetical protein
MTKVVIVDNKNKEEYAMDFNKLRKYTDKHNNEIVEMSELYNIDEKYLKRLCQEIGFQTKYTYSEAIDLVRNLLMTKMTIDQIIIRYGIDKNLI